MYKIITAQHLISVQVFVLNVKHLIIIGLINIHQMNLHNLLGNNQIIHNIINQYINA